MKPTRISTLVIIAVVCAAVGWLLLRAVYAKLPPLPWTGVPALLIAAVAEAWMGRDLKTRIAARHGSGLEAGRGSGQGSRRGSGQGAGPGSGRSAPPGPKPDDPQFVSRMVALAKASSVAAAIIAGFAAGFDFYLAGSLTASTPRQDALTAAITFVAAVLLACAALYLEYCCRVPADPGEPQPDH
jgi:hypothetical protein